MKIYVQTDDRTINIIIPTALIFSRPVAWIAGRSIRKYAPDAMGAVNSTQLKALFAEFRRIKKRHGSWELVNVEDSDGDKVRIIL